MLHRFILFAALIFATAAHGQWQTSDALPVPTETLGSDKEYLEYATDTEEFFRGAADPLGYVFNHLSSDARKLLYAGFPEPLLAETITIDGDSYLPYFWVAGPPVGHVDSYRGSYSCNTRRISVNRARFPYLGLQGSWQNGGRNRVSSAEGLYLVLMHELMHSIQANVASPYICDGIYGKRNWAAEAKATGIAGYFIDKRNPGFAGVGGELNRYIIGERSYAAPLVSSYDRSDYRSSSFIRYLIEGTERGGRSDLAIVRDLTTELTAATAVNDQRVLKSVEDIIRPYNGDRPLALVFSEFLTEFGSYSKRYGRSADRWIRSVFGPCERYEVQPGIVVTQEIFINWNAGRCIDIRWQGVEAGTALQFKIESDHVSSGSLHLGESFRTKPGGDSGFQYCYDVTSRIDHRLSGAAETKCMLRRAAAGTGATRGATGNFNGWTTDFNLQGSGRAMFILTNAAENMAETQKVTFDLAIGTNRVVDETGASLKPRRETDQPVRNGRTLMDSRVHAIAGGPGRLFFDGRSIFGDGIDVGFLEGAPGAEEIDGGGAIVRAGDYMIMLIKDKQGVPDAAMIVRDPQTSGGRSITTLGTQGLGDIPSCGYAVPATIDFLSKSDDVLRFKVSGDLFDFSPTTMMAVGQNGFCNALRAAHVEYKSIEVSLPFPELYDGNIEITRAYPPMQDIYDELEFRSGPSFGGIATSASIVLGDGALEEENAEDAGNIGDNLTSGGSSAVQCTCHCPNIVSPTSGVCFNRCEPVFQMCPDPNSPDALNADASQYSGILREQGLADAVREMLLSDFSAMSGDTRSQIIRDALWN